MKRIIGIILSVVMLTSVCWVNVAQAALAAPSNLRWNNATLEWDAVPGASWYRLALYKNGEVFFTTIYSASPSYNMTIYLKHWPNLESGNYTISVASAVDYHDQSGDSAATMSSVYQYIRPEYTVSTPVDLWWDGNTANWNEVENASHYMVEVYRNGIFYGGNVCDTNSNDFSWLLTEDAEYKFRVLAFNLDIETYATGSFSDFSPTIGEAPDNIVITATSGEGGTVTGGGAYDVGDTVTLTAVPEPNYTFDGWYENNVKIGGAGTTYTFTASADRTLEAIFIAKTPSLGKVTGGEGPITMQDVLLLYQYFRGNATLTQEQLAAADVKGDGIVNMQNVLLVYQYFRGKITEFPASN